MFTAVVKFATYGQFTDTPGGTFWCCANVQQTRSGEFSISVGVRYDDAKWFRVTDQTVRHSSTCPDEACCRRPPEPLARRWDGYAWPAARAH
jgi:hypothetical protein